MLPFGGLNNQRRGMAVYKMKKCPTCIGFGACSDGDKCPTCEGTGEVPSDEVIIDDPCQPAMKAFSKG
jgi:DnaJ-class molecular chaperone